MSRLSSSLSAVPNSKINWKRLANCHMFLMRDSVDGCFGAWSLRESSSSTERLRAAGIFS